MKTAKLFQNGRSQDIWPKEFRFTGHEVFIKKQGNTVGLIFLRPIVTGLRVTLYYYYIERILANLPTGSDALHKSFFAAKGQCSYNFGEE